MLWGSGLLASCDKRMDGHPTTPRCLTNLLSDTISQSFTVLSFEALTNSLLSADQATCHERSRCSYKWVHVSPLERDPVSCCGEAWRTMLAACQPTWSVGLHIHDYAVHIFISNRMKHSLVAASSIRDGDGTS